MKKFSSDEVIVIKPVWWRQACFTLFLFILAIFFSFVGYFGPLFSWAGTIFMTLVSVLSLLDQIFEWSRLRIDREGYSLRGWFRNQFFAHHEIKDFKIVEFTGKKLLAVEFKDQVRKDRGLTDQPIPFPCCFGRSIDEVFKTVRSAIDRTPRSSTKA